MDTSQPRDSVSFTDSQLVKLAFGEVVRSHRQHAGFRQRTFSHTVGISNSHLRSIEDGTVSPTLVTIFKIASTLGEDASTLVAEAYEIMQQRLTARRRQREGC